MANFERGGNHRPPYPLSNRGVEDGRRTTPQGRVSRQRAEQGEQRPACRIARPEPLHDCTNGTIFAYAVKLPETEERCFARPD